MKQSRLSFKKYRILCCEKIIKVYFKVNVNTKIQINDLATKWEDEYRGKSTDFQFFSTSLYYKIHEIVKKS